MPVVAGIAVKVALSAIWVSNTVVQRKDLDAEVAVLKRMIEASALEQKHYTDSAVGRIGDRIQAAIDKNTSHSDHNHDDMDIKWAGAISKIEAVREQSATTQKPVLQMLMQRRSR